MKARFKAVLVSALLMLSALVVTAPAANASIGKKTGFSVGTREVWAHFQPSLNSEWLEVTRDDLWAICSIVGTDREVWNLVYDDNWVRTGFVHASALSNPERNQSCDNVGRQSGGVFGQTWVHLHPREDWAYMTISPGHNIASLCTLGSLASPEWGLFLDHSTNTVGFTWVNAFVWVEAPMPSCFG